MLPAPGAMMPGPRGVWWRSHRFRRAPTASRQPQAAGWTAGRYGIGSIATMRKVLRGLPGAGAWSTPRRGAEGRACRVRPRRPRSGNARCCRLAACRSATRGRKALGCDDAGTHGRQAACRARVSAPFGAPARNPTRRPGRRLKALPPRYRPTCPMRCAARKSRYGSGTKRVSAGRAPSPVSGPGAGPDANGPASLAPAVCPERAETAAPVMPYANTAAMTSPKSRRPSLKAPTPSWRRTGRGGPARRKGAARSR